MTVKRVGKPLLSYSVKASSPTWSRRLRSLRHCQQSRSVTTAHTRSGGYGTRAVAILTISLPLVFLHQISMVSPAARKYRARRTTFFSSTRSRARLYASSWGR